MSSAEACRVRGGLFSCPGDRTMKKDGIREKVSRDLHCLWDHVLTERIPDDLRELVERLR
jgi:hypothetical protein